MEGKYMNESSKGSSNIMLGVIGIVVGIIVGFGIAKAVTMNKTTVSSTASTPSASTKAADLRADLVTLGTQHMDLTDQAINAALDGTTNAAAAKADLINNGTEISAAVGSVYGADAQKQFQDLWNLHLVDFINYAVADKSGDAAAKAAALTDIHDKYTVPISMLLSGANPNLPEAALESGFGDHVTGTAQMIDAHIAGNYTQETQLREAGTKHLEGLMSTLAGAIVKQYPSKF